MTTGVSTIIELFQAGAADPKEFFDNRFIKELEDTGFIKDLYGQR